MSRIKLTKEEQEEATAAYLLKKKDSTVSSMQKELKSLQHITRGCRPDMHEPDEQDLKALVIGNNLDNAMGNRIEPDMLAQGHHEIVVILNRYTEEAGHEKYAINLATLIALARTNFHEE
jgi:hypothetical protein